VAPRGGVIMSESSTNVHPRLVDAGQKDDVSDDKSYTEVDKHDSVV